MDGYNIGNVVNAIQLYYIENYVVIEKSKDLKEWNVT